MTLSQVFMSTTLAPQVLMEIATLELVIMADVDEVVEEDMVDTAVDAMDVTWIDITAGSEGTLLINAGEQVVALKGKKQRGLGFLRGGR